MVVHVQTVLEVLKGRSIPISLWILIGSIIGGLLLLALIIFVLWKVCTLQIGGRSWDTSDVQVQL